ncbi:MAG TPA: polysaccharide deacetylase family protein [Nitrososphaeraceae archaeon]|nr:polysaccharide deacetylase family protein [Nitrososphaeraceae archaeon]
MKEGDSVTSSQTFLILILVIFSLISEYILTVNITTGIDAFAKKNSKTSSSDRADSRGSNRDKGSDTTSDLGKQGGEPTIPLPVETPTNNKFVIINFDDSHQSDYTYAKPILDKYGFKATFFEVCNWVEAGYHDKDVSITWQQIAALQQDGMDIESHTMTHPNLNDLSSQADLNYEIGQSKQCLENHGFNPTIFAYPNGKGSDNSKVVNTVAKYYDLARTDTKQSALAFLNCDGNNGEQQQIDCRTYFSDGTLTPSNRYSINSWAHKHIDESCSTNSATISDIGTCTTVRHEYNNAQMFQKFVTAVNSQNNYNNRDGMVRAISIIVYHTLVNYQDLSDSNRPIDTTVNLFDAEMRYLYDNGFKVLTMADLGYDTNSKSLYLNQ